MKLVTLLGALLVAGTARAQTQPTKPVGKDSTARDTVTTLGGLRVTADRDTRPALTRLTMPVSASITATPQTRVVRPTTREVVYIEGRPGERTGHRRQGRDD
jgi:hypothetical protein